MANAIIKAMMVMMVAFITGVLKEFKYTEFLSDIDFGIEKLFKIFGIVFEIAKIEKKKLYL